MIICVLGKESFFARKKVKELCAGIEEIDISNFDSESQEQDIISACEAMPFFSDKRIVLVKDINLFKNTKNILSKYIENPSDTSDLILVSSEYEKNKSLYKLLEKSSKMYFYEKLNQKDFLKFIEETLKDKGVNFNSRIPQCIAERSGYLVSEDAFIDDVYKDVCRLCDFSTETHSDISTEMVERIVNSYVDTNLFKISSFLNKKDWANGSVFLKGILDGGVSEMNILGLLLRYYRISYKIKLGLEQELGMSSYQLKDFKGELSLEQLEKGLELVSTSISNLKGGIAARISLELLWAQLSCIS